VNAIVLTPAQREELKAMVRRTGQAVVRRARVVLLTADGVSAVEIAERLDLSPEAVSRIRKRYLDGGIEALHDRPKAGRKDHALTSETIQYIVQLAQSPPPRGRWRWTTRLLASYFGITSGAVSDVLRKHGVKPHLVRTYKVSRAPQFAEQVKDVVGLFLSPPEHAIVLSLNHERQGVLDLHAALEATTSKGKRALQKGHARVDLLSFLEQVERVSSGEELHVLLDNSAAHRTPEVREWLAAHPSVHVHYTPTRASWLRQVEGFFELLGKPLKGTDFESKETLREHLRAYLRAWKQHRIPFEWTKPARAR
jgi:transposase